MGGVSGGTMAKGTVVGLRLSGARVAPWGSPLMTRWLRECTWTVLAMAAGAELRLFDRHKDVESRRRNSAAQKGVAERQ